MLLAVKSTEVAVPVASVTAVFCPLANAPLAPLPGAANVTVAPLTGLLPASFTCTVSAFANGVLIAVLCGDPAVTSIDAAGPAWFVRAKPVDNAPTVAVTV